MHLNVSRPWSHFGNRRPPAANGSANIHRDMATGADAGRVSLSRPPRKPGPLDRKQPNAVENYTRVTRESPRHCREAAPLRIHNRWPIWRIPEPPILFLLVGKRGNAGNGSESALQNADVAQLVEHHLAKVDVASSNLVVRSQDTVTAKVLFESALTRWVGREARQRPAKPYTRVRIPYPPR